MRFSHTWWWIPRVNTVYSSSTLAKCL